MTDRHQSALKNLRNIDHSTAMATTMAKPRNHIQNVMSLMPSREATVPNPDTIFPFSVT